MDDFSWARWLMSPGFGGLAAVLAAAIAWAGVSKSVNAQREVIRKQQWWERARWALDLTLDHDSTTRAVGFEVLDALARNEWASEHESEVIDAAVAATLDGYEVSHDVEHEAGTRDDAEAHWEPSPESKESGDDEKSASPVRGEEGIVLGADRDIGTVRDGERGACCRQDTGDRRPEAGTDHTVVGQGARRRPVARARARPTLRRRGWGVSRRPDRRGCRPSDAPAARAAPRCAAERATPRTGS